MRVIGKATDRDEWLQARRGGLGASDMAAVAGLSPYSSPYELWAVKTGRMPERDDTEAMWWGRTLESVVLDVAEGREGWILDHRGFLCVSDETPWAMATLDAMNQRGEPVEAKKLATWGPFREIPDRYAIQMQWQIYVTGASRGWLAVLHNATRLDVYEIERDDAAIAALLKVGDEFWSHVIEDTPPDIDGTEQTAAALAAVYATPEADAVASLGVEADEAIAALTAAKADQKNAATRRTEAENRLKQMLGEAPIGETPAGRVVEWAQIDRKGYTVEATTYRKLTVRDE